MIVTAIFAVPVGLPRPRFLGTGLSFGFIVKTTLRLYLKKFQSLLKKFLYCQEVSAMCRAYNDENDEKDHASQVRSCVAQLAHVARRWPGRADRRLRRRNLRGGRAQCLGGAGLGRARPTWARAGALSCASERTSQERAARGGSRDPISAPERRLHLRRRFAWGGRMLFGFDFGFQAQRSGHGGHQSRVATAAGDC